MMPRTTVAQSREAAVRREECPGPASSWMEAASAVQGLSGPEMVVELAHDLRSPLTSIVTLAELLGSGTSGPVNETQRRQLGLIYSAALGLCGAASDVIELARGGAERLVERTPTPFSIREVCDTVYDMVRPMAEVKHLAFRTEHHGPDRWTGHPRALSRVLLNLSANAVKYTDAGSVQLAVRATGPQQVEFAVQDTGRGFDRDTLQDLYRPFRNVLGNFRSHFSSSGLGLAICRTLVAEMGSELQLDTKPGSGSRFFFELDLPVAA